MSRSSEHFLQLVFQLLEMREKSLAEISTFVLEQGTAMTGSAMGFLGFVSEDQRSLVLHSWNRNATAQCEVPDKFLVFDIGKAGWWGDAIRQWRTIIVNDYNVENPSKRGLPPGHVPIVRFMCVPLIYEGRAVMAMGVSNKPEPYTDQDAAMLEMALAVHWALLSQQQQLDETTSKLKASDALLKDIALGIPGAVFQFRYAPDGTWSAPFVSEQFLEMLGLSPRAVREDPEIVSRAILEQDRDPLLKEMWHCAETGKSQHRRFRIRVDGELRTISTHAQPHNELDGAVVWNGVLQNETALVQLESQLQSAQKLEAIGRLAAGVAHEINTPMQYIGDNTSFVKQACTDFLALHEAYREVMSAVEAGRDGAAAMARARQMEADLDIDYLRSSAPSALNDCLEGIARVSEIVSAMKSFAHPGQSSFEPVDINAGLRSTLIVSRNEWKYVAHVQEDLESTLSHVSALGGELHQVWLNLVVNAAQAIAEKVTGTSELGTITVSSRRIGDIVRIAIADTGPGIPEKARSRLFEPFFTTKPEGKGTGQGLPIAWDVVVNKHKGRLWFDTEEGVGTTFYVELPIMDPEIEGIS